MAGALVLQGALGAASFSRMTLAELDGRLEAYLATALLPGDEHEDGDLGRRFYRLRSDPGVRSRVVQDGVVLAQAGGDFPQASVGPDGRPVTRGDWRLAARPLGEFQPGTRLEAALSLLDYKAGLNSYYRTLALTVPLLALLGAAIALALSGGALRPLRQLTGVAGRVAESGDLTARVPLPRSGGELRELSLAFNAMLARLEEFRRRESDFTRYASHELRTPLAAMRAQLDARDHGWADDPETLAAVRAQVERMTGLTRSLLVLAREGRSERVPFDLAALAQEVTAKAGVPLEAPPSLAAAGDPELVRRALENLLENAARHAPGAAVRVSAGQAGGTLCLTVEDEGPGLSEEALANATTAFYRPPGTRAPGSGLGLAVVERVAQALGGTVRLENRSPHGLRVSLEWPAQPAA